MYDGKKTITVAGTVSRFVWANPHVHIHVRQIIGESQSAEWVVECGPPATLGRLGWSAGSLHVGDKVTVVGHPPLDPAKKTLLPDLIKRDEVVLFDWSRRAEPRRSSPNAPSQ